MLTSQKNPLSMLLDIKNNSVHGAYHFRAVFLKECAEELCDPLLVMLPAGI